MEIISVSHHCELRDFAGTHDFLQTCYITLKGPSQSPPFSMPSKLFTLFGEAKSYCFSVRCVSEGMFDYL